MATKSKLEQAVETQIEGMNDAQRELMKSQLSNYRKSKSLMAKIEDEISVLNAKPTATREDLRLKQTVRAAMTHEYSQLSIASNEIASTLFDKLEDKE